MSRPIASALVLVLVTTGCYFGRAGSARRNATLASAALVVAGSVLVIRERSAMEQLPTSADRGSEVDGVAGMVGGLAAITAGVVGIVINTVAAPPDPAPDPAPFVDANARTASASPPALRPLVPRR